MPSDPAITPELVAEHNLTPEEYEGILELLGREPNYTELGIFSVMWSEHCSYKNTRVLLKGFPTQSPRVLVAAGEENAGILDIGDDLAISFKIESHNHPSAVEPFQGAATGVGGIIRDIFTMGARPVCAINSLRFGELGNADVRRLFRGVVSGIAHYGNCFGIPTVGGEVCFDKSYEGNPLVNAFALGVLRHDQIARGAAKGVGNPVFYVGPATGRDGLAGAAFASQDLTEESAEHQRGAVQVGDPFMEKLCMEACLELLATGAVAGIQDMGAAGLTCSTCETAARGGTGIEIDLAKVPQRSPDMTPYEILLSESPVGLPFGDVSIDDVWGGFVFVDNGVRVWVVMAKHVADLEHGSIGLCTVPAGDWDFSAALIAPRDVVVFVNALEALAAIFEFPLAEEKAHDGRGEFAQGQKEDFTPAKALGEPSHFAGEPAVEMGAHSSSTSSMSDSSPSSSQSNSSPFAQASSWSQAAGST